MKIAIGAGHGGNDPGAVYGGRTERDVARQIVSAIKEEGKAISGLELIDVTDNDSSLSNDIARVNGISNLDLALQIHLNAGVGGRHGSTFGVECWYDDKTTATNRALADKISDNLNAVYGLPNRPDKPDTANRWGRLGWTSDTYCPAILVEFGFLDAYDIEIILGDIGKGTRILLHTIITMGNSTTHKPDPATKPAPAPNYTHPMIYVGCRNAYVKELQKVLNAKGFNCGVVDGIFGIKTKAAVMSFQRAKRLQVDAIVGPLTWGALGV